MKTLLRHAPTGLFFQATDQWTGNREEALDFKSIGRAVQFAEQAGFSKMELAFISDRLGGWTSVPLTELRATVSVKERRAAILDY